MTPIAQALLVLLAPLAAAALIALFLRRHGNLAAALSVAVSALVAFLAIHLAFRGEWFRTSWTWLKLGGFTFSLGFDYDRLAALMLFIVGIVGLCVHAFSLGYMKDDAAKARYFGGLSIFMFSMIGIVLAGNLFMIFIFWELVGFSSWLLINHWHERKEPPEAAKKAFITNRVGDWGFLLGIIACYWAHGTTDLAALNVSGFVNMAPHHTGFVSAAIPLLLFCGAVGKSAQLPLQVWLPDAMEGPTPVSALIHAATMVAAGVYMLCRIEILMVPQALTVITWVGTATALYAALCAVTRRDIKKVLAYSTISQLGYMVAAFGLGSLQLPDAHPGDIVSPAGVGAAMFHLTTHAWFKALLFLGSGSVILACHHEQDIFRMGGLASRLKVTFATFTVGVAAISGLPFLAGFYSKDAILALAFANDKAVFAVLAFTAVLTAFYMIRLWILVFLGSPRSEAASRAHEGGTMLYPLLVLAILAAVGGATRIYPDAFGAIFRAVPEAEGAARAVVLAVGLGVLLIGAGAAWAVYGRGAGESDALAEKDPRLFAWLVFAQQSFDRAYEWYIAKVQQRAAMLLNFIDLLGIAGLIRGMAGVVSLAGLGTRALHTGRLGAYLWWFFAGVVVLWLFATGVL